MTSVASFTAPVTLTGRDVRLEPMRPDHAEGLFAASREERIWDYLPTAWPTTLDEMRGWLEWTLQQQASGSRVPFVVIDAAKEAVLGSTSYLDISEPDRHLEIGWTWYNPSVWRSRVNTECKYLLLRHAFETLGCVRVQWRADERNQRSRTAILRLGAQFEGILRKDRALHDGYVRSSAFYSMLDDEWPARKAWFEEKLSTV